MIDALSAEAYDSIRTTKARQQAELLSVIAMARHPSSADLERFTGIQRTSVTGRLRELELDGRIRKAGTKRDPFTGRTVHWYAVTEGSQ